MCLRCGAGAICVLCPLLLVVASGLIKPHWDGQRVKVVPELRLRVLKDTRQLELAEKLCLHSLLLPFPLKHETQLFS